MMGRPTKFELLFRRRNDVIKTRDGRYFTVNGAERKEIPPIITASLIAVLGGAVIVWMAEPDWLQPILLVYILAMALYGTALIILYFFILMTPFFSEAEDGAAKYNAPRTRIRQEADTGERLPFKDYLFNAKDGYVRSGGRYFTIVKGRKSIVSIIMLVFIIAASALVLWLSFSDDIWFAWFGEVFLLIFAYNIFESVQQFRRCRFEPVPQDTPAWHDAAALEYSPQKKIISIAAQALALIIGVLVLASGGYTLSLIRSQLDGGGVVSARFSADYAGTFYNDSEVTEQSVLIPVSDLSGEDVWLTITVVHTPHTARLSLDGKPLPDDRQPQRTSMYGLQDYFIQEAFFDMSGRLLHDGSVLTLTCGDLVREWVFDVADEEAL